MIYGGSLHTVGINGINYIKQNMEKLKYKKVVVFATGATPYREDTINEVRNKNFTVNKFFVAFKILILLVLISANQTAIYFVIYLYNIMFYQYKIF